MLRSYDAKTEDVRTLPLLTLPEIRNMILLTNPVPDNAPLENKELLMLNPALRHNRKDQSGATWSTTPDPVPPCCPQRSWTTGNTDGHCGA